METPTVKPTVGRIVHYVPEPGSHEAANHAKLVPAVVVAVWGDGSIANLKVFCDGPQDTWVPSAHYNSDKVTPRTWHWPSY